MSQKTILITGANSGIGFETTKTLAQKGHRIIMVTRKEDTGQLARKNIIKQTNSDHIYQYTCDLASFKQVRDLSTKLHKDFDSLDVHLNNAGIITRGRMETEDGNEYQFQVNHLSHFLLTQLNIDLLRNAQNARIINVSSNAHKMGKIHFSDLNLKENYSSFKAYSQSKLANILFTYATCSRVYKEGLTSNALHPGAISSNFGVGRLGQKTPFAIKIFQKLAASPVKGAETSVYLATSEEVNERSGGYYKNKKSIPSSKSSYDPDSATALWEMSLNMVGLEKSLI